MKEITLLIGAYFFYVGFKEIYHLYKGIKNKEYVDGSKHHSIQHIIMIIMLMLVWIAMLLSCTNDYLTPLLLYELMVTFYIMPHLILERTDKL